MYERAVPRFRDLAAAERFPLTLFVVGADLERPQNARLLREMGEHGHELGNHTFDHHYDLTRRSEADIRAQIARANEVVRARAGQRPTGFRAPGYTMSDAVYRALAASGMAYSSSVFPCPYYYAAKVAVIGGYRLTDDGRCLACGTAIPGRFDGPVGRWGARRLPVSLAGAAGR